MDVRTGNKRDTHLGPFSGAEPYHIKEEKVNKSISSRSYNRPVTLFTRNRFDLPDLSLPHLPYPEVPFQGGYHHMMRIVRTGRIMQPGALKSRLQIATDRPLIATIDHKIQRVIMAIVPGEIGTESGHHFRPQPLPLLSPIKGQSLQAQSTHRAKRMQGRIGQINLEKPDRVIIFRDDKPLNRASLIIRHQEGISTARIDSLIRGQLNLTKTNAMRFGPFLKTQHTITPPRQSRA